MLRVIIFIIQRLSQDRVLFLLFDISLEFEECLLVQCSKKNCNSQAPATEESLWFRPGTVGAIGPASALWTAVLLQVWSTHVATASSQIVAGLP